MDSIFHVIDFIFSKFTPDQILGVVKLVILLTPAVFFSLLLLRLSIIWTETKDDDTFWVQKVKPFLVKVISIFEIHKVPKLKSEIEDLKSVNEAQKNTIKNLQQIVIDMPVNDQPKNGAEEDGRDKAERLD